VRSLQPIERRNLRTHNSSRRTSHKRTPLHMPKTTLTLKTHNPTPTLNLPPPLTTTPNTVLMNRPKLPSLRRTDRRITLRPRKIPNPIRHEAPPKRRHNQPQIFHDYIEHGFITCSSVVRGYDMSKQRHIQI
jgi:hypothetical protein